MAGQPAARDPSPVNVVYCTWVSEVTVDVEAEDVELEASVDEGDRVALVDELLENAVEVKVEVELEVELEVVLELDEELELEVDIALSTVADDGVEELVPLELVVLVEVSARLELVDVVELEEVEVEIEANETNVIGVADEVETAIKLIVLVKVLDVAAGDELNPW